MFEKHPAAIQFGVPRGKPNMAYLEAMVLLGVFIFRKRHRGNNAKRLETAKSCKTIRLPTILQKY
jgi:hypothetical protein